MKKILLTSLLTLFSLCLFAQVPNYVPTNGLIGWWPFNGNANDESGNGLDGTINGAILTSDRFGISNKAFLFDVNQSILINNTTTLNPYPLTISLWYKATNWSPGESSNLISKYASASWNGFGIGANDYNNVLCVFPLFLRSQSDRVFGYYGESPFDQTNITLSQWYHYVFVLDSTGGKIYVDGNLISTHPWTGTAGTTASNLPLKIGGSGLSGTSYRGLIDDIGIWDRALTECEIADLYNAQFGSLNSTSTQIQTALDSYTWTQNGQTYTQSGTYTDTIPNAAGCDSTITLDLSLSFTGMIELNGSTLTLSPNPVQDVVSILVDSKLIGEEFTIIDQLGAIVLKGTLKSEKTEIDLSKYSSGMYLFRLTNYSEKVIRVLKK
jgi:hypothetical protein